MALLEDLSSVVRYTFAVDSLKQQMVEEVFSIRKQMDSGENANAEYVRGVHDAYVSLVQALDALGSTNVPAPQQQVPASKDPWEAAEDSLDPQHPQG